MSGMCKLYVAAGAALAIAVLAPPGGAHAAGFKVLHSYTGGDDGFLPEGLVRDRAGNLYGATDVGGRKGIYGLGAVFDLSPDGSYNVLYAFKSNLKDGKYPIANVARDKAGNLYGTTEYGGGAYDVCRMTGCGIIYEVAPDGSETVLHRFEGSDGADPDNTPIPDAHGNLYGTTFYGGAYGSGVVFGLSPKGKLDVLHSFSGSDGAGPAGALIADQSGDLYGATVSGGESQSGVIYKLAPDGTLTVLHAFQGLSDGSVPNGPLVRDADGNLYGTTVGGGSTCGDGDGCGVAFKLAPDGTLTVLHVFTAGSDGGYPEGGLIADGAGNLYGVTVDGGIQDCQGPGCGVVFKLTADGTETVLYSFDTGDSGFHPQEGLTIDGHGDLYGTTWEGGADGFGTIFRLKN
ncbi:MAG: choice-of-anchor tandem repeat GloVer-containing protein [Rhizomicrobium sp.]